MGFDRDIPRRKIWYWRYQGFVLCLALEGLASHRARFSAQDVRAGQPPLAGVGGRDAVDGRDRDGGGGRGAGE